MAKVEEPVDVGTRNAHPPGEISITDSTFEKRPV
jgi:hypothetical protein